MNLPTNEQFRRLVLDAPDVVAILEADLTLRYVCRSVRSALGYPPEEVMGRNLKEYLHPRDVEGMLRGLDRERGRDPEDTPRSFEVRMRHEDGSWRDFDAMAVDRLDDPGFGGIAVYLRDVTERKAREEQLARQALHDGLTGLPNRALFMDRLSHALGAATREREPVAVLFVDVDDFKAVNDSLGHAAGDGLLVEVAGRMRACLRPGDTVARLGGDEFAVLIEENTHEAGRVAQRLRQALAEPLELEGKAVRVFASVGIATSSNDRPEDLLRAADASMYRDKKNKARRASGYGGSKDGRAGCSSLEARLRRAVEREELALHYQAAAAPDTRSISWMEALLRWEAPEADDLAPRQILDLAQRSGLGAPLGRWILGEACAQALLWRERWPDAPLHVSVNVSASQFQRPSVFETVGTTLQETGLPPEALVLEIAAEALIDGGEGAVESLNRLRSLGVRLAMDDFSPGNPELPDLGGLPVDFVKFDRSLVKGLGGRRKNARLLASLYTGLAKSRGIRVVAVGVESAEQLEELETMDCDLVQGFYLWGPLPGPRATELLTTNLGPPG